MSSSIRLIVGLGNPGLQYVGTRHNAGLDFLQLVASKYNAPLKAESRYQAYISRANINNADVRLLFPSNYMNNSGTAVAAIANFYKYKPQEILVVHDELDLPPGAVKLKLGGGHGGHNGLRDIISKLGNEKEFYRLRIGIGHPGNAKAVTSFVLGKPQAKENNLILQTLDEALLALEPIVEGDMQKVMNSLHRFKAKP